MRVLVAGASGVIGRQLVPLLRDVGHEVIALSRQRVPVIRDVQVVSADALDATALRRAVSGAAPDAVVNLLTAIPPRIDPRRLARDMAATNRLRVEGTANLLAAAGGARMISEGLAYAYRPPVEGLADEDTPLWSEGPRQLRPVVQALIEHESLVQQAGGLVLRFGHLYGPGSAYALDGSFIEEVRAGKVPVVGHGSAVFSFTHAHDAATSIVAALDKNVNGVLNVVDDDPATVRVWLPHLADLIGAPAPKHVPTALARMAVGGWGVAFMTRLAGVDSRRARLQLDWRPRYTSWRAGFAAELLPAGSTTATRHE